MYPIELVDLREADGGNWVDVILTLLKITSILEKSSLKRAVFLCAPCFLVEGTFLVQQDGAEGSLGFIAALWVTWESWPCHQESIVDSSDPKSLHLWIQLVLGSAKPQIKKEFGKHFWKVSKCKNWNLLSCCTHTRSSQVECYVGTAGKQDREGTRYRGRSGVEPRCSWDPGINSQLPHKSTRWEAHPVPKFMQGTWVSMEFGILGGVKNVAHRYWGAHLNPIYIFNWMKCEVWVP